MKRVLAFLIIGILCVSAFSIFTPHVKAVEPPVISLVSAITATRLQTIHIYGSGFGNTWPQTVSLGDGSVDTLSSATPYMCVSDNGKYQRTGDPSDGGDNWAAGIISPSCYAMVGIILLSWSDNEIVLGGFGTALGVGQGTWYIANGDPITVTVVTSSGQTAYTTVVGAPTMYTVTIASGTGGSVSYSSSYGSGTVASGQSTSLQVASGAQVSLTANPDPTYCFQTWGVDNFVTIPSSELSSHIATATISENVQITAYFGLKTVTSTSVTCSPSSTSGSSSVTCTAIVSPFNPTGSVVWTTFPNKGSFSPSTCTLTPTSAGLCSTTYTPDVSSGTTAVTITATYSGDPNNEASSGSCQLGSAKDPNSSSTFNVKLANGIAQPNLYKLDSSVGKVQQIYDENGLSTWVHLSGINTGSYNLAPVGYSEAMYGCNLDGTDVDGSHSSLLQFPMQISSLDSLNLWGTAAYSLSSNPSPSDMPYNFFYDLWIKKNQGGEPQPGDFEVGISLAHGGQIGPNPYEPAGSLLGFLTDQIYVNGQQRSATWYVYFELAKGTNQLDYSQPFYDFVLGSPSPQNDGTVSIRFQDFVDCLSQLSGGKDISTYKLMGIELGTEYSWNLLGPLAPNRQATWTWTVSSYYLTTNSNNFLTIVTSANAPGQVSRPPPTLSPQLTLIPLASEATGVEASIIHEGSAVAAIVDQTITTGVKTIISGLSLQVGTQFGVGSLYYGANQPSGTGLVQAGGTFFDVKVHALSGTVGSDVTAAVYLTNSGFTASGIISYWDGNKWVPVATTFIAPDTVWCTLPVSYLTGTPIMVSAPPLSVSISPLSASILVGQSVTFTSTVSGGYTPYSYQWCLNGAPVSGATSASWTFTPTTSGIYYVYAKVTDTSSSTTQSETARIIAAAVPVGGYSVLIQGSTRTEPISPYIALIATLTAVFTKLKPKTKRKR